MHLADIFSQKQTHFQAWLKSESVIVILYFIMNISNTSDFYKRNGC